MVVHVSSRLIVDRQNGKYDDFLMEKSLDDGL